MKLFNQSLSIFFFICFSSSLLAIEEAPFVIEMEVENYPYQLTNDKGELQGRLQISVTVEIEPFVSLGVDGHLHGLYVDIWNLWSEKTGISISFSTGNMDTSLDLVRNEQADVHIGYPESESLKTGLQREQLLYQVKSRLFSFAQPIESLSDLTHTRIGAVPTAPYLDKLTHFLPDVNLKLYNSVDAMIEAVIAGDISSFVASSAWTQHYLVQKGVASDFYQFMELEFDTDIYVLSAGGNAKLSTLIKQGFALINRDELAEIEQKWMLDSNNRIFSNDLKALNISEQEQAFLNRLPPLKVGYLNNWKPMEYTDNRGMFAGVNSELVRLFQDKLGLKVETIEYQEWQELISDLIEGKVDLAGSVAKTVERAKQLHFSDPYWPSPWALATPIDRESIFNVQQLSGQRVAIVEGYQLISELMVPGYGVELVLVADTQAGLKAVSDGLADAFIEKVINMAAALKQSQVNQLKMSVLADFSEQHSHFGIHPDKAKLAPLINQVLNNLTQADSRDIYRNWITPSAVESSSKGGYLGWVALLLFLGIFLSLFILMGFRLFQERSQRKQLQSKLLHLTNYDTLTLLPNRSLLEDRLEQSILLHGRELATFAVLFVDLGGVKSINTDLGHKEGDLLIKKLVQVLRHCVRRSDTLARFSNDEFVVILNRTKELDIVCQVAEAIVSRLSEEFEIAQTKVNITTSIGIAMFPVDGDTAATLLKTAGELMFRARKSGGNCYKSS
ncbi:transporter substrate-binding domain-containing protein [Shewanella sp. D64]|uniref:diguanylate cyclase domain-containing protein n=1 Tax=unclassified Shewanella TaxID=196818 RepID=UPI0022BA68D4|nr:MULTISPECIES: transporter substrate-binding domain-containing protein [unclassified Shewanella]MEC4725274.1 transporter substrate-binding domain-containing protein [Shewanella sp. D64]MEC4735880.1 transporter substrate-binding domain-containing protein [Shewanella sp. E94]WBJ93151.1 transporter substrate-binding domain-containing protein [Shewanella sp. MTB7]